MTSYIRNSCRKMSRGQRAAAVVLGIIGGFTLVLVVAASAPQESHQVTSKSAGQAAPAPGATDPRWSPQVQAAHEDAVTFLEVRAFSRQGLIEQLQSVGYSVEDATAAIPAETDFMVEAERAAAEYEGLIDSRGSMVDQLVDDGFTSAEAEHGAAAVLGS